MLQLEKGVGTDHMERVGHEGKRMDGIACVLCQYGGGRTIWIMGSHTGDELDKEEDGIDRQEDTYPRRL